MSVPEEYKELDLYALLEIDAESSPSQIKKAYRKRALATHPDKGHDGEEFRKVAFAFSVLGNEKQRELYDKHGIVTDIDEDIAAAFRHFKDVTITPEMIEQDKAVYRKEEERQDSLHWYKHFEGDFDKVFAHVLHTEQEDEERIKQYIEEGIKSGELKDFKKYRKTTSKKMNSKRKQIASREAKQAEKQRKKLGINSEGDLAALIKSRQAGRKNDFLDGLAERWT